MNKNAKNGKNSLEKMSKYVIIIVTNSLKKEFHGFKQKIRTGGQKYETISENH